MANGALWRHAPRLLFEESVVGLSLPHYTSIRSGLYVFFSWAAILFRGVVRDLESDRANFKRGRESSERVATLSQ